RPRRDQRPRDDPGPPPRQPGLRPVRLPVHPRRAAAPLAAARPGRREDGPDPLADGRAGRRLRRVRLRLLGDRHSPDRDAVARARRAHAAAGRAGPGPSGAGPPAAAWEDGRRRCHPAPSRDPRHRTGDRRHVPLTARLVAVLPIVAIVAFVATVGAIVWSAGSTLGYDFQAYAGAADRILHRQPLYDPNVDVAAGLA